ncbi:MAG: hypothetical protein JWN56_1555 [Sphingobacteriales bacterium]|nr:hypothetical protein [Sphingobacteriales bacterium]
MTNTLDNTVPSPDSQRIEDEPNANSNFSNVTDNYDPNDLTPEESLEDDFDDDEEDDDIAKSSNVDEPDLDEDEIARVFPNQDDEVPDPDDVDGTSDFDEDIDPAEIDIPDEYADSEEGDLKEDDI